MMQLVSTGACCMLTMNPDTGYILRKSNTSSLEYCYLCKHYDRSLKNDNLKVDQKIIEDISIDIYNNEVCETVDIMLQKIKDYKENINYNNDIVCKCYDFAYSSNNRGYFEGMKIESNDVNPYKIELNDSIDEYKKEMLIKDFSRKNNVTCIYVQSNS